MDKDIQRLELASTSSTLLSMGSDDFSTSSGEILATYGQRQRQRMVEVLILGWVQIRTYGVTGSDPFIALIFNTNL